VANQTKTEKPTAAELSAKICALYDGHDQEMADVLSAEGAADLKKALDFIELNESENPLAEYTFLIPGDPPVSKRPRTSVVKGRAHIFPGDGDEKLILGQLLRLELPRNFVPLEGEVRLDFNIFRPVPAGFPQYKRILAELGYVRPEKKPDFDNYAKIFTDALTMRLFKDDGQCVSGRIEKYYSKRPRLEMVATGRRKRMC
jgi:Holliday junction resolvase RusA-like endonuclease